LDCVNNCLYLFNFDKRIYNNGCVIELAETKEQMCELDRIAVGEIASYLFQMMEKTGRNIVSNIIDKI